MKIIDVATRGNVVRFFLGEKDPEWGWTNKDYKDAQGNTPEWLKPSDSYYGDDWDDAPYEENAGGVYAHFVKGIVDVAFGYDDVVLEPWNSLDPRPYSKNDMVKGLIPCLIVIKKDRWDSIGVAGGEYPTIIGFSDAMEFEGDGILKYHFGDEMGADGSGAADTKEKGKTQR